MNILDDDDESVDVLALTQCEAEARAFEERLRAAERAGEALCEQALRDRLEPALEFVI